LPSNESPASRARGRSLAGVPDDQDRAFALTRGIAHGSRRERNVIRVVWAAWAWA